MNIIIIGDIMIDINYQSEVNRNAPEADIPIYNILDKSLAYDGYDEVTINNLIRRDKKDIIFIRNALGIHIAHNGHTRNFLEFEILFLNEFFRNELSGL